MCTFPRLKLRKATGANEPPDVLNMNTRNPINALLAALLLVLFSASCARKKTESTSSIIENQTPVNQLDSADYVTLTLRLDCLDLSENTALSTKKDEILLLLYSPADQHSAPLLMKYLSVVDAQTETWEIMAPQSKDQHGIIVIVEVDTDKTASQLEPVIRLNQKALTEAYKTKNRKTIRTLLGDDDLIGIASFPMTSRTFDFKGVHLFDTYHYLVGLTY